MLGFLHVSRPISTLFDPQALTGGGGSLAAASWGLVAAQTHEGQRQAFAGIEVAGALVGVECGGKGGCRQVLRRRLAHRAGDADDAGVALTAPGVGKLAHGARGIRGDDDRLVAKIALWYAFADRCHRAVVLGVRHKPVAILSLAWERGEEVARLGCARIRGATGDLGLGAGHHQIAVGAHRVGRERCGEVLAHGLLTYLAASGRTFM